MEYKIYAILFVICLFLSMLISLYFGRKYVDWQERYGHKNPKTVNAMAEGAIFALLGLLVAFTFSTASQRFDGRRALIIEETNAIGTAYLRLDLLPSDLSLTIKSEFKEYIRKRLELYKRISEPTAAKQSLIESEELQKKIWDKSLKGCSESQESYSCMLLLPALNNMFDIANTRLNHTQIHPPVVIFLFLIGLALLSSFLAGYNFTINKSTGGIYVLSYSFVITLTIYLIIDMEYPRLGLIRVDSFDQILMDIEKSLSSRENSNAG
jgi:hypothetical protein